MKLTIESSDSLDSALKSVGALFGVELQVAEGSAAPAPAAAAAPARRRGGRRAAAAAPARAAGGRGRRGARSASSASASTSDVRTWARANGYTVSERGRISADVLKAYSDAH